MSRLTPVDPSQAEGKAKDLLDAVKQAMGATPNIFTTMANAPAALEGLLGLNGALSGGALNPQLREKIALVTAGQNGCDYCASAHTFLGDKAGIEADELASNLKGQSIDAKDNAALIFASQLIENRGRVTENDVQTVRKAGFNDEEIIEILTHVALNTFTNYFNEAFQTENDFPAVSTQETRKAA
ncbi:MAG: peroxidase [Micavibrio sp. TMED27]|nr:peroxidase [Micavibrio sp.]OUT92360.1 MAG: peroxidase [Micavibrio sp. TMED27]|tara:strand:+ start:1412 stop:1966 length:555 start_codon:yes stop_codon:yes gene_type:complete